MWGVGGYEHEYIPLVHTTYCLVRIASLASSHFALVVKRYTLGRVEDRPRAVFGVVVVVVLASSGAAGLLELAMVDR